MNIKTFSTIPQAVKAMENLSFLEKKVIDGDESEKTLKKVIRLASILDEFEKVHPRQANISERTGIPELSRYAKMLEGIKELRSRS